MMRCILRYQNVNGSTGCVVRTLALVTSGGFWVCKTPAYASKFDPYSNVGLYQGLIIPWPTCYPIVSAIAVSGVVTRPSSLWMNFSARSDMYVDSAVATRVLSTGTENSKLNSISSLRPGVDKTN